MSNNPYAQVALTYLRRPFSSWPGCILAAGLAGAVVFVGFMSAHPPRDRGSTGFVLGYALMTLAGFFFLLVFHVKDQFADVRAQLVPGFRRVHGTMAIVGALVFAVLFPAAFTWLAGIKSVGFIAASVFLFSAVLWAVLGSSAWYGLCMMALWLILMIPRGQALLVDLVSGRFEPGAFVLMALGVAITAYGMTRLFQLNEDMPEYHRRPRWDANRKTLVPSQWQGNRDSVFQHFGDCATERQMASLTRHVRNAATSRWSQICRWQVGMFTRWTLAFWIAGMVLYVQFLTWIMPGGTSRSSPIMIFMCVNIMPLVLAMGSFTRRAAMLAHELLMPVDREVYLRQAGAAAALSHLQVWASTGGAIVVWWLLCFRHPMQPTTFITGLAISAAFQIWAFAAMAWAFRHHSRLAGALGVGLCCGLSSALAALAQEDALSDHLLGFILVPSGAVAILGLAAIYWVYRRWLVADLE